MTGGGHPGCQDEGGVLFTALFRGSSVTVGPATRAELAELAEPWWSAAVDDELLRWTVLAIRTDAGRRTTVHAVGWQRRAACAWTTSPLRELSLGPLTVTTISGQSYLLVGEPENSMGLDLRAQLAETLTGFGFEAIEDRTPDWKSTPNDGPEQSNRQNSPKS